MLSIWFRVGKWWEKLKNKPRYMQKSSDSWLCHWLSSSHSGFSHDSSEGPLRPNSEAKTKLSLDDGEFDVNSTFWQNLFASECVQNALAIGIEAGNRAHAAAWVKRIVQRGISRYLRISTHFKAKIQGLDESSVNLPWLVLRSSWALSSSNHTLHR